MLHIYFPLYTIVCGLMGNPWKKVWSSNERKFLTSAVTLMQIISSNEWRAELIQSTSYYLDLYFYMSNSSLQPCPDLRCSTLTSFATRPSMLSQARKFARTMLKVSSSCWTPTIRSSRSTILLTFGSKAPLKKIKKLRKLGLVLRRGPWRFKGWLRGLHWLKLASRCSRTLQQRAPTTRQGLMRMLACYEEILKEKKGPSTRQTSVLDFKSSSVSPASPPVGLLLTVVS
jgi:hypothetical protein